MRSNAQGGLDPTGPVANILPVVGAANGLLGETELSSQRISETPCERGEVEFVEGDVKEKEKETETEDREMMRVQVHFSEPRGHAGHPTHGTSLLRTACRS